MTIKKRNNEKGAATILEYSIVLPIVLGAVLLLIFLGFSMQQKAVMEAACQRIAIYATRAIADPSYDNIASPNYSNDSNEIESATITKDSIVNAPYRYLLPSGGSMSEMETALAELIRHNQIFTDTAPSVSVKKVNGIFTKVQVSATQEFSIPKIFGFELDPIITIHSDCTMYATEPAELIRNADLMIDAVTKLAEKLGITAWLNQLKEKIFFFKNKVK